MGWHRNSIKWGGTVIPGVWEFGGIKFVDSTKGGSVQNLNVLSSASAWQAMLEAKGWSAPAPFGAPGMTMQENQFGQSFVYRSGAKSFPGGTTGDLYNDGDLAAKYRFVGP